MKWDNIYSGNELVNTAFQWYPDENVVRFTARFIKRRVGLNEYIDKKDIKRVLDLGCGNGKHVLFFTELGYDVVGIDISPKGIELGKKWLKKNGLSAELYAEDLNDLSEKHGNFDLILSCGVLDHIPLIEAKKAIQKVKEKLNPGGYLYITLRSTLDCEYGSGKEVDKNTFVLQGGYEKGEIQHFFDLEEIHELLIGFNIFDLELHEQAFPDSYTVDKAFLQSSSNISDLKYINPLECDLSLKYSRWYIAAKLKD